MRIHRTDPSRLVEAAFQRIYVDHMSDVPVVNPALRVQALDFALWQNNWLGVLITPWFINLMLLPGAGGSWESVMGNQRRFQSFPSGKYAFLGGNEAEIGEYQSCSLISAMAQFEDQEGACAVASEVIGNILKAPQPVARQTADPAEPSLSKRKFLMLGDRR